ncbi:MAG: hypothetical protein JWM27_4812 [Gemmatimonadetes bacterium]|nr:hypothetical protein [Gemmatimonadota bacterium]
MQKLNIQDLEVVSFITAADGAAPLAGAIDTQQLACWSPFCAPSFGRTCPETAVAA